MIPVMDMVVLNTFSTLFEEDYKKMNGARIQVRLFNLQETRKMRDLNPSDIDQLVRGSALCVLRCASPHLSPVVVPIGVHPRYGDPCVGRGA